MVKKTGEKVLSAAKDTGAIKIRRIDYRTHLLARAEGTEKLRFPALQESNDSFTIGQSSKVRGRGDLPYNGALSFDELGRITFGGRMAHGEVE